MNLFLLFTMSLVPVPDRPMPKKAPMPKSVQEALIGEWKLVSATLPGGEKDQTKEKDTVLTFTPLTIQIAENGKRRDREDASYSLDINNNPVAIDIIAGPDRMERIKGIIKIEGDRLTLCFVEGEGPRPTEFAVSPNTMNVVMVLSRISKK